MNSELNTILGAALARAGAPAAGERARVRGPEAAGAGDQQPAAGVPATDPQARPAAVDRRSLDQAVNELTKALGGNRTHIQFNVDDESGQMVIKVIDVENDKTIRQIPPQEVLELAKFFSELEETRGQVQDLPSERGHLEGLLIRVKA